MNWKRRVKNRAPRISQRTTAGIWMPASPAASQNQTSKKSTAASGSTIHRPK
jgi:hypothetical protein